MNCWLDANQKDCLHSYNSACPAVSQNPHAEFPELSCPSHYCPLGGVTWSTLPSSQAKSWGLERICGHQKARGWMSLCHEHETPFKSQIKGGKITWNKKLHFNFLDIFWGKKQQRILFFKIRYTCLSFYWGIWCPCENTPWEEAQCKEMTTGLWIWEWIPATLDLLAFPKLSQMVLSFCGNKQMTKRV